MNVVIILSGGIGTRMQISYPKQYILIKNKPIIMYSFERFAQRNDIDAFVVVVANEWIDFFKSHINHRLVNQPIFYALPGDTRQQSVYNALKVVDNIKRNNEDVVIIHDAVRPLVTDEIIDRCINGCSTHDGVLPVIKVKDTIYQSKNGADISNLLNRSELFSGQSPESFLFEKYYRIHNTMSSNEISRVNGSSEIAVQNGLRMLLVPGDEINFKITTPEDIKMFEQFI